MARLRARARARACRDGHERARLQGAGDIGRQDLGAVATGVEVAAGHDIEGPTLGGKAVADDDVVRIDQPLARRAPWGAGVQRGRPGVEPAAGGLDEAAVACLRAAPGAQAAVGPRRGVTPQDDAPAVTAGRRVGRDARGRAEVDRVGVAHARVLAQQPAAQQHLPTATGAGHVHRGRAVQPDVVAEQLDLSARAGVADGADPA